MGKAKHDINDSYKDQNIEDFKMESNLESSVCYIKNHCIEIQQKCKKLFDDAKIYEKLDCFMKFMLSNPLLLFGFIVATATLITPIVLFTIFAIINVAIVFSSFIIVEVMLMMIGITILGCVLFLIISAVVLAGVSFILSFYVFYFSISLVKKKLLYSK